MTDAEFHLTAERDELRRQVACLREERERWRKLPIPLTDAEREAVAGAIAGELRRGSWAWADTLRGLLERMA